MKWSHNLMLVLFICTAKYLSGQDSLMHGQRLFYRLFNGRLNDSSEAGKNTFIVPVLGHAPESGYEYGVSGYKNFLLPDNNGFRISTTTLKASLTTRKSSNFIWDADLWSDQNRSHLYAEIRSQKYPLYYYGIGNNQPGTHKELLDEYLAHINIVLERMVLPSFYLGGNFLLEEQDIRNTGPGYFTGGNISGKIRSTYAGLGLTAGYDTRDNVLYTHTGCLIWGSNMLFPASRGGVASPGSLTAFNLRYFISPAEKWTVGYDLEYEGLFMKDAPFYLLPQLGNDERMRGYYAGRARDRQLFTDQIEIRYHFVPRFAVVTFAGMGSTSRGDWSLRQMKPSIGMGCRYFFDIKENSTIRFDYAWGQKRPHELRQKGYYLTLGEAF